MTSSSEVSHYVVTAHPPGGVLCVAKGNFIAALASHEQICIAKSRRLELRSVVSATGAGAGGATSTTSISSISSTNGDSTDIDTPCPIILSVPINGRIVCMLPIPISIPSSSNSSNSRNTTTTTNISLLFILTVNFQYAILQFGAGAGAGSNGTTTTTTSTTTSTTNSKSNPYPVQTLASGHVRPSLLGKPADGAPLVTLDPQNNCLALHLYDGFLTILPLQQQDSVDSRNSNNSNSNSTTEHVGKGGATASTTTAVTASVLLGEPYHIRMEELNILDITFVMDHHITTTNNTGKQIAILQQDARGMQHVHVYTIDLRARTMVLNYKKQRLDGGSSTLIAVPTVVASTASAAAAAATSTSTTTTLTGGGVLVLGQRQITYLGGTNTYVVPLPTCLILSSCPLPPSPTTGAPRYLLGDEFGNIHMLSIPISNASTTATAAALELDTLGSTNVLSSALCYMEPGVVFVGSQLGDSQLLQIHPQIVPETNSYLSILDEYTNLGPIVDLDVVASSSSSSSSSSSQKNHQQNQSSSSSAVVTASGSSSSGTIRLVKNGIGMKEFAAVELAGIQNMWAVRQQFAAMDDTYLVQSYVAETRILGVVGSETTTGSTTEITAANDDDNVAMQEDEDDGATLEEVLLPGLDSTTASLYVGNCQAGGDLVVQITASEIRLLDVSASTRNSEYGSLVHTYRPDGDIAVAAANEAGQLVVALRGGQLLSLVVVDGPSVKVVAKTQLSSEVSCLNVNPFALMTSSSAMDTDSRPEAESSAICTVGLWDDFTVRVLDFTGLTEVLQIHLSPDEEEEHSTADGSSSVRRNRNNMMARSLCLVTLDCSTNHGKEGSNGGVDMLFVGLGDGTLISFAVVQQDSVVTVQSKKEVSLGTQRINLIPLQTKLGGTCVLATGDRPTVIYLAGGGGGSSRNPKLCYSNVNLSTEGGEDGAMPPAESIAVNVAAPFHSPQLFDDSSLSRQHYSLCVSDDSMLRLGVIDDIQKLHVTTCRLGMAPRRVVHCPEGRLFAVGCIESGIFMGAASNSSSSSTEGVSMGNCLRFLDETTFDDIERIDLEPHEMILSMVNVQLATSFGAAPQASGENEAPTNPPTKPYLLVGTAYALPDEDEPGRGRILLLSCKDDDGSTARSVKHVTELQVRGGVYSICQFYNGLALVTVNSRTQVCQLTRDAGALKLSLLGIGHHGHILSLMVQSKASKQMMSSDMMDDKSQAMEDAPSTPAKKKPAKPDNKEQLAIVGDLMRSISLVQYYPEHKALEEVARDFNSNWTTAIEMLTDNLYLGAENWNNLYVLRRNAKATSEEIRCRLDTVGWFHLGELCNKFISGSLTMPQSSSGGNSSSGKNASSSAAATRRQTPTSPAKIGASGTKDKTSMRVRRPVVTIGSQTLFATVDGTLGSILGLDARTAAFFTTLERAMAKKIAPVGNLGHAEFRTFDAERRIHPAQGFVDGDLVESFLDLDLSTMEAVVDAMNRDGGWEIENHNKKMDDADGEVEETEMSGSGVSGQSILVVEDVLAMVEEMAMFH